LAMVFIEEITETQYEKAVRLKREGNDAFKRRANAKAKSCYSQALQILEEERDCKAADARCSPPLKATLLSNRCQVYLALDALDDALRDATASVGAAPSWPKAHHRLGSVHMRAGAYSLALESYERARGLDPEDAECAKACARAHDAMAESGLLTEEANPTGAPAEAEKMEELPVAAEKVVEEEPPAAPITEVAAAVQPSVVARKAAAAPVEEAAARADGVEGAPRYEVALTAAALHEAGVAECVVTVWLPRVESMSQLDVEISSQRLHLKAAGLYELDVELPKPVCDTQAKARFAGKGARKGTLTMRVPLAAHG